MKRAQVRAFYSAAHELVQTTGFGNEVEWFRSRIATPVSEQDFLRESAWVILCSGFREGIVRRTFDYVSLCFWDFSSARRIARSGESCVDLAMAAFANRPKLEAIGSIAQRITRESFDSLWRSMVASPVRNLQTLPFIGPITAWHLAKNLGMSVAKPDRHLNLLANKLEFSSAFDLCDHFSRFTGEPLSVVDTVLWRATVIAGSAGALIRKLG